MKSPPYTFTPYIFIQIPQQFDDITFSSVLLAAGIAIHIQRGLDQQHFAF